MSPHVRYRTLPLRSLLRSFSTSRSYGKSNVERTTAFPIPFEKEPAFKLPSTLLSYHSETLPPTRKQLQHATQFFTKTKPRFLWSAEEFKNMPFGDEFGHRPEVCFLGRSNVGKSSLMNAILGTHIAYISARPGRTKMMNAFGVGHHDDKSRQMVILDMPGYGKGGQAEWGVEIMRYLEKRRQFCRVFLLVDSDHGIKISDQKMLALCKERGIPFQVILSKVDRVLFAGKKAISTTLLQERMLTLRNLMENVHDVIQPASESEMGGLGEVLACSGEKRLDNELMGINAVRFAILRAANLHLKDTPKAATPVKIVSFEDLYGRVP
ncbi:GTP-binding protein [Phlyctema vagabunda]|uniref:GTP-binding protein 8 n=1 Tax=Phlyctema vagabunda TaxID=108571 RepID=A0ABR4PK90_9HELO